MGILEAAAMQEQHQFTRNRLPQMDDDFSQAEGYTIVGHVHDEAVLEKEAAPMSRLELRARLLADRMPVDPVAAEMARWEVCSAL